MAIQWSKNERNGVTAKGTKWLAECWPVSKESGAKWKWHFISEIEMAGIGGEEASDTDAVKAMVSAANRWIEHKLGYRPL